MTDTDRLIRSSGTQRRRPHGCAYTVTVTGPHGAREYRFEDFSIHTAMRRGIAAATADGLIVHGVTGLRTSQKRKNRGKRRSTAMPTVPVDWDAIDAGRFGLHRPNGD